MFLRSSVALTFLSFSLFSCAKEKPPESPQASEPTASDAPLADQANENEGTIKISKTIQQACGLSDSEAHFKYDSAALQSSESSLLDKVATCFITGPLAGERMNLVGRADPRGDEEYNIVLGGHRSDSVKVHLVGQGMNADYIAATSRGELDATGDAEAGWRQDRRVDVMLPSEL
jgi:peptidoglycan-associated lipoprotein